MTVIMVTLLHIGHRFYFISKRRRLRSSNPSQKEMAIRAGPRRWPDGEKYVLNDLVRSFRNLEGRKRV